MGPIYLQSEPLDLKSTNIEIPTRDRVDDFRIYHI